MPGVALPRTIIPVNGSTFNPAGVTLKVPFAGKFGFRKGAILFPPTQAFAGYDKPKLALFVVIWTEDVMLHDFKVLKIKSSRAKSFPIAEVSRSVSTIVMEESFPENQE